MRPLRLFATAPHLPSTPFATAKEWEQWIDSSVRKCKQYFGPADNLVVLPEMVNLPLIFTGGSWRARLSRRWIRKTKLAMLLAGGQRAITRGLPGVMAARISELTEGVGRFRSIARRNACYLLASGLIMDRGLLVNRLWIIAPSGEIVHLYDKQKLMPEEQALGISAGENANPFFRIAERTVAAVICFDMFDKNIQEQILAQDVEALLVPSANPRAWSGYAESGTWQPVEWLEGSDWLMNGSTMFVNSMLRGKFGTFGFDGQPFIRSREGKEPCSFPDDRGRFSALLPSSGFYPEHEGVVFADI